MDNELTHYGVLGMKWGIRRTPAQLGHLTKKDNKWIKKNAAKITEKARKKSSKELSIRSKQKKGGGNSKWRIHLLPD